MNKEKRSVTDRNAARQRLVDQAIPMIYKPIVGKDADGQGKLPSVIDVHKMAQEAAVINTQKANAGKTGELSGTKRIEPTGLFNT